MIASTKAREDLKALIDRLPDGRLPEAQRLLEEVLQAVEDQLDAQAARKALSDPERIPYETVRRELGLK